MKKRKKEKLMVLLSELISDILSQDPSAENVRCLELASDLYDCLFVPDELLVNFVSDMCGCLKTTGEKR